ncbi:MAG: hypothetical protein NAG76_14730 [Candidatus Pristimantibacillus lignocellulolyticus]|uniref:Uncharacterized protein n=1 Tax=Candidatus Pristimantibacillus lignocellulolyticus TaxID=2994561 RepID=A0A9J6ZAK8_9BACL|nr:MAG: hypothetical protein NAG76_14730 [Candidatus Pristimantibacillus lignocellulolyticus]
MEKLTLEQKKYIIDTARKAYENVFKEKLEEGDFWTRQIYYKENTYGKPSKLKRKCRLFKSHFRLFYG